MNSFEQIVVKMYQNNISTYEICEKINKEYGLNFYPNKVNRLLKKLGLKIRTKSESQKIALESNRSKHPTEGRQRSIAEKTAIGKTMVENWKGASPERRENQSRVAKNNWNKMSEAEKVNFRSKSAKAIRAASVHGSKLERFILGKLRQGGWSVDFHTNHLLPNGKLEMDIFVRDIKTVIEIDGITHYEPIHGEEIFERVKYNDNMKNAMAMQNGYKMVRVRCTPNKVSLTYCTNTYEKVKEILNKIKENPLIAVEERLIYVE